MVDDTTPETTRSDTTYGDGSPPKGDAGAPTGAWRRLRLRRLPSQGRLVVAILLALAVAGGILALGSAQVADPEDSRWAGERRLDDGELSAIEIQRVLRLAEQDDDDDAVSDDDTVAPKLCDRADENYQLASDRALPIDTPSHIVVLDRTVTTDQELDADAPLDVRRSCQIVEGRRLPETGTSVLLTAALGGLSLLIAFAGWSRVRKVAGASGEAEVTGRDDAEGGWTSAWILGLLVAGLTIVVAGHYRFEAHLLVALTCVVAALVPWLRELIVLGSVDLDTDTANPDEVRRLVSEVRQYRYRGRLALGSLSIIFSVSVALAAALNARFVAVNNKLSLRLGDVIDLGGFTGSHVGTVTTIESLLYATILIAAALPALHNVEHQGAAILDNPALFLGAAESKDQKLAEPLRREVAREEAASKLGLKTRPVQWLEGSFALLLPLITGASADFLGLLG